MEIEEGNKLIAEFMLDEPKPFSNSGGSGYDIRLTGIPNRGYMSYSLATYGTKEENINKLLEWPLFYHISWDWLMPVIDKIEQYKYSDGDTAFLRTFSSAQDGYMVRFNRSQLFQDKERIKATWLAVIDILQWFNNQKLNS